MLLCFGAPGFEQGFAEASPLNLPGHAGMSAPAPFPASAPSPVPAPSQVLPGVMQGQDVARSRQSKASEPLKFNKDFAIVFG